jgi:hypothetical protein
MPPAMIVAHSLALAALFCFVLFCFSFVVLTPSYTASRAPIAC